MNDPKLEWLTDELWDKGYESMEIRTGETPENTEDDPQLYLEKIENDIRNADKEFEKHLTAMRDITANLEQVTEECIRASHKNSNSACIAMFIVGVVFLILKKFLLASLLIAAGMLVLLWRLNKTKEIEEIMEKQIDALDTRISKIMREMREDEQLNHQ